MPINWNEKYKSRQNQPYWASFPQQSQPMQSRDFVLISIPIPQFVSDLFDFL